jgi:uncharacterized protein YndB with AHSA1/START domain
MVEDDARSLVLERRLNASCAAVWRCWTEAPLIIQWFTPAPWTTPKADLDVRPGGENRILMRGPNGEEVDNVGVYLAVEPLRRLVFTDAFSGGFRPSASPPFMVVELTFSPDGEGCLYRAVARHWTSEAKDQHVAMGFHEGWGRAADQLDALALTL